MLRTVFGKPVDTYYFDEHYHIDAHHGRMAFEYVVAPAIARHGNGIIPDIVRGMEELQLLTAIIMRILSRRSSLLTRWTN